MNTKTVLVILYLLYLIVVTMRIAGMKKLGAEATTHLVVAVLLGMLVYVVQRANTCCLFPFLTNCDKKEGFNAKLNYTMSQLDGMNDSLSVEKNKPKSIPVKNDKVRDPVKNAAPVDYRMSSNSDAGNTIDPSHQDSSMGTRLDYRVSSYDGVETKGNDDKKTGINTKKEKTETPNTYESGAPTDYRMGPYAGVRLDTEALQKRRVLMPGFKKKMFLNEIESNCGDLKSPCNVPYQQPKFITPTGVETTPELSKQHNPSIDGKKGSKRSMFMFSHNVCHPGCCPSTYSCDHGCVCTNKDQREYLGNHGAMKKKN